MGEGLRGAGANFGWFLQLPYGALPIFRRWLLGFFGQDCRSPFWVSFGRFSGTFQEVHEGIWGRFWAFQEAHEGIWGLFWACLELIVGRRWMALREADAACRLFSIKRIHGACGRQIMRPCPC